MCWRCAQGRAAVLRGTHGTNEGQEGPQAGAEQAALSSMPLPSQHHDSWLKGGQGWTSTSPPPLVVKGSAIEAWMSDPLSECCNKHEHNEL